MSDTATEATGEESKEHSVVSQPQSAAASVVAPTSSPSDSAPSPASSSIVPPAAVAPSPSCADLRLSNLLQCPPPDELARHVAQQLLLPFASAAHPELEGKLGRCVLPASRSKPSFPALLDCLLPLDPAAAQHAFEAEVPMRVFRHLNDGAMKGRFEREQDDSRRERRAARLSYSHPVTVDLFYATSPHHTRVTVDAATGSRIAVVAKRKLASLDFLSPPLPSPPGSTAALPPSVDFRLTLAEETPVPLPPGEPFRMRRKDRRSYGGEWWQVDCTVVETWAGVRKESTALGWAGAGKAAVSYEVELELVAGQAQRVKEEAVKAAAGRDSALLDIARNLLDNMRSLSALALRPLPASCMPRQATAAAAASATGDSKKRSREEMEETKEPHR